MLIDPVTTVTVITFDSQQSYSDKQNIENNNYNFNHNVEYDNNHGRQYRPGGHRGHTGVAVNTIMIIRLLSILYRMLSVLKMMLTVVTITF